MSEITYRNEIGRILTSDEVDENFRELDNRTADKVALVGDGPGGAGYSLIAPHVLPSGFAPMPGYDNKLADNFGNVQYRDGSVMVVFALMVYRIGHASNSTFSAYGVNSIDTKYLSEFDATPGESKRGLAQAHAQGYVVHQAFYDDGEILDYFALDKYICSSVGL